MLPGSLACALLALSAPPPLPSPPSQDSPSAYRLAASVVQRSAQKLLPALHAVLGSAIAAGPKFSPHCEVQRRLYDVIQEVFQVAPQALMTTLPMLQEELLVSTAL